MKTGACIAFGLALIALPVCGGTITGRVTAHGKEIPGGAGSGAYQSKKFKFAEKVNYDEIKDFIVYVEGAPPASVHASEKVQRIVVQENALFSPHVLPVMVGTTVEWPNEDDIFHNVFSFSDPKPFDLGLYKDEVKRITFDKVGRVDIFCSIHKNMNCIIMVLENPWFAATDQEGRYTIADVPAGTYQVRAWHERLPAQVQTIVVPEEGPVNADFTLGITGLPKY